MSKITFVEHGGTEHVLESPAGTSLMQAAINNLVPGIVGDCGGICACATCHGYVDEAWLAKLPPKKANEESILTASTDVRSESRLLCQIQMRDELDGIVIRLPESQY